MILSCQNICKAFGEKVILNDASFHIEDREKAALIGCNGAGKTTLLRIIMQELSADSGTVVLARDKNIGYLAQYQDIHGHHTIYEELLTTKQHIIDMERRIRNMEQEMNTVKGDDLNRLMEMTLLWHISDVLMGVMALINIPVILLLSNTVLKALKDYEGQIRQKKNPVFFSKNIDLKQKTDYWN